MRNLRLTLIRQGKTVDTGNTNKNISDQFLDVSCVDVTVICGCAWRGKIIDLLFQARF